MPCEPYSKFTVCSFPLSQYSALHKYTFPCPARRMQFSRRRTCAWLLFGSPEIHHNTAALYSRCLACALVSVVGCSKCGVLDQDTMGSLGYTCNLACRRWTSISKTSLRILSRLLAHPKHCLQRCGYNFDSRLPSSPPSPHRCS